MKKIHKLSGAFAVTFPLLLLSCVKQPPALQQPSQGELVEVYPVICGVYKSLPRIAYTGECSLEQTVTKAYDTNQETQERLESNDLLSLPDGTTLWLLAQNESGFIQKSYVVSNSGDEDNLSYLVPCTVDDKGNVVNSESSPLYLKENEEYTFYAISPARKLDIVDGNVILKMENGEFLYANDCRYSNTSPRKIVIESAESEGVTKIPLAPMINQTARLMFRIEKDSEMGVHDIDVQPSGIVISGLQYDAKVWSDGSRGVEWRMSQNERDEPFELKYGERGGVTRHYEYELDPSDGSVNIEVGVLPMRNVSKPVTILFGLIVNGVPTTMQMMINERDFKAGYSYGYKGMASTNGGVTVITWQYISWEMDVPFPFTTLNNRLNENHE